MNIGEKVKQQIKVGKELREAREKKNLTQADVAIKAKININYYAMIERGEANPALDKICSILKVLGMKLTLP